MDADTKQILKVIMRELRYTVYEFAELKTFNYPKDKENYERIGVNRIGCIEKMLDSIQTSEAENGRHS